MWDGTYRVRSAKFNQLIFLAITELVRLQAVLFPISYHEVKPAHKHPPSKSWTWFPYHMKWLEVFLPWWGASPSHGYPPYQASLTLCLYPFILLSGERHCESMVSCPRTQHMDWPGLEPRPLNPESSTLTIRPPHLWHIQWVGDGFLKLPIK